MEHGTPAGYDYHRRHETPVCDPCRIAARAAWKRARVRRKAGLTSTYNPGNKLEEFRKLNPGLEPAIVAVWNNEATAEQRKRVDAWYERAWGP